MRKTVLLSSLSYSAQQWGFKNEAAQTLSVEAVVSDGLDWFSAYGEGWTELVSTQSTVYGKGVSHDTPEATTVEIAPEEEIAIAPGQVLTLKWTIHSPTSGKAGMMGIDDVVVGFQPVEGAQGFSVRIVSAGNPFSLLQ